MTKTEISKLNRYLKYKIPGIRRTNMFRGEDLGSLSLENAKKRVDFYVTQIDKVEKSSQPAAN
jgi:hypothetical protein